MTTSTNSKLERIR